MFIGYLGSNFSTSYGNYIDNNSSNTVELYTGQFFYKEINMTEEELKEMKQLTLLTGKINDIQLKNLKTWPFVIFDNVTEVKLEYDVVSPNRDFKGWVRYSIKGDLRPEEIEILKKWVKTLFWNDIEVYIDEIR